MILIKDGRVIDPNNGIDETMDILIDQDKIAGLGKYKRSKEYERVIEASGKIAAPGLSGICEQSSGCLGETSLARGITNMVRTGLLTMSQLLERMAVDPAKRYKLECVSIEKGKKADIIIFDEFEQLAPDISNGEELYGKVKYVICGGKILYEDKPKTPL